MDRDFEEEVILRVVAVKKFKCCQCGATNVDRFRLLEPREFQNPQEVKDLLANDLKEDIPCVRCGSIFKDVPDTMVWN